MSINAIWDDNHMKDRIAALFDCLKILYDSDIERIIDFVLGIVSSRQQLPDRPACRAAVMHMSSSMAMPKKNSVFSAVDMGRLSCISPTR